MNTKAEAGPGRLDTIKLVAAVAVFIGGIVAYYVFSDAALLWRILGLLLCLAAGMGIAFTTAQGREFWGFVQGSQIELRKVVWPTRQETNRMMLVVIIAVLVFSLMMAAFDLVIQSGVKWLLGS